jgi:hypothetical protein
MADAPNRKADLDKEGIALAEVSKAELDKDGITLDAPPERAAQEDDRPVEAPKEGTPAVPDLIRRLLSNRRLVAAAALASAFVVVVVFAWAVVIMHENSEPQPRKAARVLPRNDDGLVLDPFMVFYETHEENRTGVLVAQVSLKVDPAVRPTITGRLYDIRNIIYRRLKDAASVYSQTEIALMLSDDLVDYPIQEVAFLQYRAR